MRPLGPDGSGVGPNDRLEAALAVGSVAERLVSGCPAPAESDWFTACFADQVAFVVNNADRSVDLEGSVVADLDFDYFAHNFSLFDDVVVSRRSLRCRFVFRRIGLFGSGPDSNWLRRRLDHSDVDL